MGKSTTGMPRRQTKKDSNAISSKIPAKALPVTLLSGFLGSGKTTLLNHILNENHGYKIAVIVNDIGAINVDADKVKRHHRISKADEKRIVPLQNGCICCTLRGDLLDELVKLADLQAFDYVLIESSGISEPEQVAETFDNQLAENFEAVGTLPNGEGLDKTTLDLLKRLKKAGGLEKFARLDTTVTVVDAFSMLHDFDTADLISTRQNDVPEEDDRTVTDLMVDQIEFADVIIVNKIGKVSAEAKQTILTVISKLNHRAKVLECNFGKVDVKEILGTGLFNLELAKLGYGWLQDLNQMALRDVNGRKTVTPKPETEEYNVRNFVYVRHRPFHPERLYTLLFDKFILSFEAAEDDEDDEDETEDEMEVDKNGNQHSDKEDVSGKGKAQAEVPVVPEDHVILENKRKSPLFARLFRSKGQVFFATRPQFAGEWSQAGAMMMLQGSGPWLCTLPEDEILTGSAEVDASIQRDIKSGGEWGDRRQEIVFIGERLDIPGLQKALDECLLNDTEYKQWESTMRNEAMSMEEKVEALEGFFADGFPDWVTDEHDHDHDLEGIEIIEVD